ncbi:MAG: hypothetical protein AAF266_15110 [Planctomycetota bacterium]
MLFASLRRHRSSALLTGFAVAIAAPAWAVPPAASVLPSETVGYVAAANAPDLLDRWSRTQVGQLAEDRTMQPFVEQIERRFNRRFGSIEQRLGVTLEDFRSVASGEAALAIVKSDDKQQPGRVAAFLDATGREAAARELIQKIDARLVERGGQRSEPGNGLTLYRLPAEPKDKLPERTAAIFFEAGQLGVAEGERLATQMLARVKGQAIGKTLSDAAAYQSTQQRARRAAGRERTSVEWFVSPFEFDAANRPVPKDGELPEKKDALAILAEQGFDAVKGIGGVVAVGATPERDFIHHTFIYAPPKPGTEGKPAAQKYDLGMRMLSLPNAAEPLRADNPPVEAWAPRQVATYKTIHLDTQNLFEHLDTLFDSFAGYEGAFDNILTGLEKDPYGPKIKVRDEVIAHLGDRAVMMTDYTLPITTECERYLVVIDVTNEEALREPIARWLKSDGAERKELQGVPYWEMVPEDEGLALDDLDPLMPLDEPEPTKERDERVLRRAAVCLHNGRLAIGSDSEFLQQALFGVSPGESLGNAPDLRAAIGALAELAPGKRAAWAFMRSDESFRPTYELIREGKMPEAQTFFGRLLNRLLTSDDEREVDALRKQQINGERLPSFELARRYFGPSARSVRSEDDGWMITGVVLSKDPMAGTPISVARK